MGAVDPIAVATVGFAQSVEPVSFALCIATEGYQCEARPPAGGGGGWCFPEEEEEEPDIEELSRRFAQATRQAAIAWEDDVRATAERMALRCGLSLAGHGESASARLAAVCFRVVVRPLRND